MKRIREEDGQSILEFAFLLPVLLLLAVVPVDFFRYAVLRMNLRSAAVEALNQVTETDLSDGTKGKAVERIRASVERTFGESLPPVEVAFDFTLAEVKTEEDSRDEEGSTFYYYYVYDSDLTGEEVYGNRFEKRKSHYAYYKTSLQLSCKFQPATLIGKGYFRFASDGDGVTVQSSVVKKDIFAEGYRKKQDME